ncbi:hypothetical protein VE26_00810 [Devosia chinhatensis]|uniref:Uncharacterized protein n=1 Tax=Devosia chinhatensis TaxID=429727 RepID=A0A0F5FJD7_9HYPH|nr:hypothetical protein VE26_00810 [Devosia chinhatensis]
MLALGAAPAQAEWEGTAWGMSPQETLAVLDTARSHKPAQSETFEYDGASYMPMVKMPYTVDGITGEAALLFDGSDSLQFVTFSPEDIGQCDALTEALKAQYGTGDESGFGATAIYNWADGDTIIRLTNSPSIGICALSYGAAG